MSPTPCPSYLAVDLGASSGRLVLGRLDGARLELEEVHRFPNGPVRVGDALYWDFLGQWQQVLVGLAAAGEHSGGTLRSVGVDTWGVDFGLVGRGDELLGLPRHYRDPRTDGILERAFRRVPRQTIFAATGVQFMQFNTLYQLLAMQEAGSPLLEAADTLLLMPDLFHWLLTGEKSNERTNASTTQFYDPQRGSWSTALLDAFDLPRGLLGTLIEPGTLLGPLRSHVAVQAGLTDVKVVAPATHDTGSAVVAVPAAAPAARPDWCFISSGTWSLMGAELTAPVVNERCLELNFTNEAGIAGTTRLLKNIAGLWLVQECQRVWSQQGRPRSWDELTALADRAPPLTAFVDPDDPRFLAPRDMPAAIRSYCRDTQQSVPESEGAVIRCAIESIALKSRRVLDWLEQLVGVRFRAIHIVGGGTQNRPLCQATAEACRRPVVAGPVEATATGNVLVQAMADGTIGSLAEAREVVARSFPVARYEPQAADPWDAAYERFLALCGRP